MHRTSLSIGEKLMCWPMILINHTTTAFKTLPRQASSWQRVFRSVRFPVLLWLFVLYSILSLQVILHFCIDCNGYRGLVLFLANPHAEAKKLRDPANSRFIKHVAHLIGCSVAIQAPLEQAQEFKAKLQADNWHRLKIKLLFIVRLGGSLRQKIREQDASNSNDCPDAKKRSSIKRLREASARLRNDFKETLVEAKEEAKAKGARWLKKIKGGNAGISPSFTFTQMMWSFLGVAVTHCILSRIDLLITTESEGELALVLAPLGALTTLQYNLTAAPASQPRNAIFAQIFAITTTLLLGYIPGISPWFRSALAPAIVIPGMAK